MKNEENQKPVRRHHRTRHWKAAMPRAAVFLAIGLCAAFIGFFGPAVVGIFK